MIVILLLAVTMPWRLLYRNEHERVLINGERGYVLAEKGNELVLYVASTGSTRRYRVDEDVGLERLGSDAYLFVSPAEFDAGELCHD